MGYGYKLGIDLPGENRGFLPNSEYYNKYHGKRWSSSTVISIAIGQGEVLATPLQICNLAATIANRGYFITPHVVKEVQDTPLDSLYTDKRYTMVERKNYEIVAEGMRNAVIGGTCRGAAITDIEDWYGRKSAWERSLSFYRFCSLSESEGGHLRVCGEWWFRCDLRRADRQIDDGEVSERRNLGGEQVAGRDDVECGCIAKRFIFTES